MSIYLLYLENKEIVSVKSELFDIDDNGVINKEKIIELLQDKRLNDDKKYFIKDLWKYNFDLDYLMSMVFGRYYLQIVNRSLLTVLHL